MKTQLTLTLTEEELGRAIKDWLWSDPRRETNAHKAIAIDNLGPNTICSVNKIAIDGEYFIDMTWTTT